MALKVPRTPVSDRTGREGGREGESQFPHVHLVKTRQLRATPGKERKGKTSKARQLLFLIFLGSQIIYRGGLRNPRGKMARNSVASSLSKEEPRRQEARDPGRPKGSGCKGRPWIRIAGHLGCPDGLPWCRLASPPTRTPSPVLLSCPSAAAPKKGWTWPAPPALASKGTPGL